MDVPSSSTAALQTAALRFLRRFGLVAAAWTGLLAASAGDVDTPRVLWTGVGVVLLWAAVSQLVRPPRAWFLGWVVAAVGAELLGPVAGTSGRSVAGGISFLVLAAAVLSGRRGVVVALVGLLATTAVLRGTLDPAWTGSDALGTVLLFVFGGIALWWLVRVVDRAQRDRESLLARATAAEQQAAVARERGEAAARLHDSVLQTLTAIGRAGDAEESTRLAARAGAELRDFLRRASDGPRGSLVDALRAAVTAAADGAPVGVSTVGDVTLDAGGEALVDATAEAVRNAVRHGQQPVRVLLECRPDGLTAWVADRGAGFDPAEVPSDRLGVRRSIRSRMSAVGGTATLDTADGCEWELRVPVD